MGKLSHRLVNDRATRLLFFTLGAMGLNLLYAVYNGVLGAIYRSPWFFTMCAYYLILGGMRFFAVSHGVRGKVRSPAALLARSGAAFLALAVILSFLVLFSIAFSIRRTYHAAAMIGIAAYTFYTAVMAVINTVRARRQKAPLLITLRNISCAGAAAAVLSLTRSMVATFGGGQETLFRSMTAATGTLAVATVAFLGLSSLRLAQKTKE